LLDQVDQSLERSSQTVARFDGQFDEPGPRPGDPRREAPSPVRVVTLDAAGNVVKSFGGELGQERSDPDVAGLTRTEAEGRGSEPFTVDSESGTGEWRVLLRTEPVTGGTQALAVGLGDTTDVVGQFQQAQLLLGLLVILVLAGFGAFLVRVSLRPLTDIEHTAEAIGAGDLSQRVP